MSSFTAECVAIPVGRRQEIEADLLIPDRATGLVVFAHGSSSSRYSTRNRTVAEALQRRRLGTLLLDLLTLDEDRIDTTTAQYRFDIELLAIRVVAATDWLHRHPDVSSLPIGYFGAGTGAAAALIAAAERPASVKAVVSRGGRPDLAEAALPRVTTPTLLIVGGDDDPVIEMNEFAKAEMTAARVELAIVPEASHLFEEPGALQHVWQLAGDWFARNL
jgi:pimeloyl-ACP methyl ester carboxylesterase